MNNETAERLIEVLTEVRDLLRVVNTPKMAWYPPDPDAGCDHQWISDTAGTRCMKCGYRGDIPEWKIT